MPKKTGLTVLKKITISDSLSLIIGSMGQAPYRQCTPDHESYKSYRNPEAQDESLEGREHHSCQDDQDEHRRCRNSDLKEFKERPRDHFERTEAHHLGCHMELVIERLVYVSYGQVVQANDDGDHPSQPLGVLKKSVPIALRTHLG